MIVQRCTILAFVLAESDNLCIEVQSYTDIKKLEVAMIRVTKSDKETVLLSSGVLGQKKMTKEPSLCHLRKEQER